MKNDHAITYTEHAVDYLTRVSRLFAPYKRRALAFLDAGPGMHILDAGCGTGDDLLALNAIHEGTLCLCGVDINVDTLAEALDRSERAGADIHYALADLQHLPFGPGIFDIVRSDRVFQHLHDPAAVLRECIRVTRPGGRVVAVDVDWGTLVLDHPDAAVTDRICAFARDQHTDGRSGRRLHRYFREAGLIDIEGYADAVCVNDWEIATLVWGLRPLVERMVAAGAASRREADAWWHQADAHAAAGLFCGSMTGFVMRGHVGG